MLEIFVNQYFVIEHEQEEICDSPCQGASEFKERGTKEYGPFYERKRGEQKRREVKNYRIKQGWKECSGKPFELYHGHLDISLSLSERKVKMGEVPRKVIKKMAGKYLAEGTY